MIHAVKDTPAPASKLPRLGSKFEGPCEFRDTRTGVYRATLPHPDPFMQAVQTAMIGPGRSEEAPAPLHATTGWVGLVAATLATLALVVQLVRHPAPPTTQNCIPGAGWAQCSGAFKRATVPL